MTDNVANKSPERQKLEDAIKNLYVVFEMYPIPDQWIKCNSKQKKSRLHCIQNISIEDLHQRYEEMGYIPLDIDSYKCILPRLFDLIAFHDLYDHALGENMRLKALQKYQWQSWNTREQAGVKKYLTALWSYMLSVYPSPVPKMDVIVSDMLDIDTEKTPYIKLLDDHPDDVIGIQHLMDLISWWVFLVEDLDNHPHLMKQLQKAYYDYIETPLGNKIAHAIESVERRRNPRYEG